MGVLTFFEDKFENFMARVFPVPKNFQADDLAAVVCRTAERCKRCRKGQMWLPAGFEIVFDKDSWQRFKSAQKSLENRIVDSLEKMAETRGYLMEGPFHISFKQEDFSDTPFRVKIISGPSANAGPRKEQAERAVAGKFQMPRRQFVLAHPDVGDLSFLGNDAGAELFCRDTVTIGRFNGSGGPYDVEVDEKSVSGSRAHALIEPQKHEIRIMDNHSSNGVKVNGEKVSAKTLSDGDKIELGRVEMTFRLICRQPEKDDDKTYILES